MIFFGSSIQNKATRWHGGERWCLSKKFVGLISAIGVFCVVSLCRLGSLKVPCLPLTV